MRWTMTCGRLRWAAPSGLITWYIGGASFCCRTGSEPSSAAVRCDAAHRSLTSMKGRTRTHKGSPGVGLCTRIPRPSAARDWWRSLFSDTPAAAASTTVKGRRWKSSGSGRAVFMASSDQFGVDAAVVIHNAHRLLHKCRYGASKGRLRSNRRGLAEQSAGSVVAAELPLPCAEEFEFGPGRHEAFDAGQHLHDVCPVCCNQAGAQLRAPVLLMIPDLGHGDIKAALQLRQERAHHRALLLQAVNVAQKDVELNPADPHAISLSIARHRPPRLASSAREPCRRLLRNGRFEASK